jgi:hypothetical protein
MRRVVRFASGTAILLALAGPVMAGDDNQGSGLFGRLFRGGGGSSNAATASGPVGAQATSLPYSSSFGTSLPAPGSTVRPANPPSNFGGLPETPQLSNPGGPVERLTPKPRVSSAVTNADPILTRFALGRSNDGSSFGMFLQVFADGTVVDSEGVHHIRPAELKPITDVVQSGEVYRLRGHCGAPSTDFIEYVHIVVYERRFGRLQAHAFSYSGNPQGCDHIIRHLHAALENLQAKLSHAPMPASTGIDGASPATPLNPASSAPAAAGRTPAVPSTSPAGPAIPLSPADSNR